MKESDQYHEYGNKILIQALRTHKEGNNIEAKRLYQKYLDMGLIHPKVLSNYGVIYKQEGNFKKACLLFKISISKYPEYADAYINLGNLLIEEEEYEEAKIYSAKAIKLDNNNACAQNNYGTIMQNLNQHEQAEFHFKKAIKLEEKWELPYYNIGTLYKEIGNLKEAKINAKYCLDINSNFARCHYLLSTISPKYLDEKFGENLFSDRSEYNIQKSNLIYINFAKANVMHAKKDFTEGAKYLKIANDLKLKIYQSDCDMIIKKTETLLKKESELSLNNIIENNRSLNIFIVGMPRSGSTLIESILSMNKEVKDLGEINIFEEAYLDWIKKEKNQTKDLSELYEEKINTLKVKTNITTNKWLYNYQYAGLIAKYINNAKIIHCTRNPLDNILSIYRANFDKGNSYSSSIDDCAKVYLDHKEVMNYYKNKYSNKIYKLNYDELVTNPDKQIKKLISWLNLKWDNTYLQPHLNNRLIKTASNVQVRKPINKKSLGGWKNYEEMLGPAIRYFPKAK